MAARKMDLSKRCLFILSGVSNSLGKSLAIETCRRFKSGSVAVLIEASEHDLQEVKKDIQCLKNDIKIFGCSIGDWQATNALKFQKIFENVLSNYDATYFELAFIVHNEGSGATQNLMEPENSKAWMSYVQENLYSVVALNQEFLKLSLIDNVPKLIVNLTSSLLVKPFVFNSLMCSCKKAREMYFRAMASEEGRRKDIAVVNYSPGILDSHEAVVDRNNNVFDLADFELDKKILKLPRVKPLESTLKLINILEEQSFCPGHDIDYYDTFNL